MSEESNKEQNKILIELIKEKVSLYCFEHKYAEQYISILVKFFTPTENINPNTYHLTFYKNKKEIEEAYNAISKEAVTEAFNNHPKLLNAIYIEVLNDDNIGLYDKMQYGNFIKQTIQNFSQIEGINVDEYYKIVPFIDKSNQDIQNQMDIQLAEIDRILAADTRPTTHTLVWHGDEKKLKELSKKLHYNKYIHLPTDFFKAIKESTVINWLKEPETLAYLINQLYVKKMISCSVRNGYINAANNLFCDDSEKSAIKFNLKKNLDKITRSSQKYSIQRRFVDDIIHQFK